MHIPKTAGTSVNNIIKSNFKNNKIYPFPTYHKVFTNSKLNYDSYELISGHFTMSLIENIKSAFFNINIRHDGKKMFTAWINDFNSDHPAPSTPVG